MEGLLFVVIWINEKEMLALAIICKALSFFMLLAWVARWKKWNKEITNHV